MKLELGAGNKPTPGFVHHDKWKHSDYIDVAFDLNVMPWPLEDNSVDHLLAIDVFEHLTDHRIIALQAQVARLEQLLTKAFELGALGRLDVAPMDTRSQMQRWMDECYRVVAPDGILELRYPHHDNDYSFRDPTHEQIPRHVESWHYWCPDAPGTVWQNFGRYYYGPDYDKWWSFRSAVIDKANGSKDVRVTLCKPR